MREHAVIVDGALDLSVDVLDEMGTAEGGVMPPQHDDSRLAARPAFHPLNLLR
jgi:hypothetical protein